MIRILWTALIALLWTAGPAAATGLCGDWYCPTVVVRDYPSIIKAGEHVTIVIDTGPSSPFGQGVPQATTIEGLQAYWLMGPMFSFNMTRVDNTFYLNGFFDIPGSSFYYFFAGDDLGIVGCNMNCNSPQVFDIQVASPVPEPATWAMLLIGIAGIVLLRMRLPNGTHKTTPLRA